LAVDDVSLFRCVSHDVGVTMYWDKVFSFVASLCHELGCRFRMAIEVYHQNTDARMRCSVGLSDEARVAVDAKTEAALTHHGADMDRLAQIPWLGWEHKVDYAEGGRAIVLKVSLRLAWSEIWVHRRLSPVLPVIAPSYFLSTFAQHELTCRSISCLARHVDGSK
jgi:hypothetical protein